MGNIANSRMDFSDCIVSLKEGLNELISMIESQPGTAAIVENLNFTLPLIDQFDQWSRTMPENKFREVLFSVIAAVNKTVQQAVNGNKLDPESFGANKDHPIPTFINDLVIKLGPEIHIGNDRMIAHAFISEEFTSIWTMETIQIGLQNRGINGELIEENLKNILVDPGNPYMVCKGKPSKSGTDAILEDLIGLDDELMGKPAISKNGRAHLKELDLIRNVQKGQTIMKKTPPTDGEPGQSVLGELLPYKDGEDVPFPKVPNTEVAENGLELVSTVDGCAYLDHGRIVVVPALIIRGNVDYSTGNLSANVSITVNGDVLSGFTVESTQDVIVKGTVEASRITAQGNIFLPGGVQGKGGAEIQAGNHIEAKFLNAATVRANETITVHGSIIHSDLKAKRIMAQGEGAEIIGGVLNAAEDVCADFLGSEIGVKTDIRLGYDIKEYEKAIEQLTESIEKLKGQYEQHSKTFESLQTLKMKKGPLSPAQEETQYKVAELVTKIKHALRALEEKLERNNDALKKSREMERTVRARKDIFPSVEISILDETFVSKKLTGPATVRLISEELQVFPFEERTFADEDEVDE